MTVHGLCLGFGSLGHKFLAATPTRDLLITDLTLVSHHASLSKQYRPTVYNSCHSEKLATTVFRSLHGHASPYLSDDLHRLVDIPSRRRLRSASSLQLDVPRTHHRTVGDRAFTAAGPTLWNSLPHDITDCVSLTSFCRKWKTFCFLYHLHYYIRL